MRSVNIVTVYLYLNSVSISIYHQRESKPSLSRNSVQLPTTAAATATTAAAAAAAIPPLPFASVLFLW